MYALDYYTRIPKADDIIARQKVSITVDQHTRFIDSVNSTPLFHVFTYGFRNLDQIYLFYSMT